MVNEQQRAREDLERRRQALVAARSFVVAGPKLPSGTRLVPRRDGTFTAPSPHRKTVQAAVNRIANPMMRQLGEEWARAVAGAEGEPHQEAEAGRGSNIFAKR
jgi:hypothetical protein